MTKKMAKIHATKSIHYNFHFRVLQWYIWYTEKGLQIAVQWLFLEMSSVNNEWMKELFSWHVCFLNSNLKRIKIAHTFENLLLVTPCNLYCTSMYSEIPHKAMESFTEAFICDPIWIMQRENCLLVLWSCSKTPVSGNVLYVVFVLALFVIILRSW